MIGHPGVWEYEIASVMYMHTLLFRGHLMWDFTSP